jgi:cyclopropane-fatty-acyl-phospholipid synthase
MRTTAPHGATHPTDATRSVEPSGGRHPPILSLAARAPLHAILRSIIHTGCLRVIWPDGNDTIYGDRGMPRAGFRLNTWRAVAQIVANPALAVGETYMDGTMEPLDGDIYGLLDLLMLNRATGGASHPTLRFRRRAREAFRRIAQRAQITTARRNVAHHYDLDGRLYELFLDEDRQYSCAYFPTGAETLDEAQAAKKRHLAAKLALDRPGLRVLDIGSGWGGLALTLAKDYGATVTGITLSEEQYRAACARAQAAGLSDRVQFLLADYRTITETFDRIVSVGMFEHVGLPQYGDFFASVLRCLEPDGVAVLHAIGRQEGPGVTTEWIAKYIFPGGYCPALSEVFTALEPSGLVATDIEVLRQHYADTLRHWRTRFAANRSRIKALYDERFCRMFEFYLAGSELSFKRDDGMVFQIQMMRRGAEPPRTRDPIFRAEAAYSAAAA